MSETAQQLLYDFVLWAKTGDKKLWTPAGLSATQDAFVSLCARSGFTHFVRGATAVGADYTRVLCVATSATAAAVLTAGSHTDRDLNIHFVGDLQS